MKNKKQTEIDDRFFCRFSPDEDKHCACLIRDGRRWVCTVYGELLSKLKKVCPLTEEPFITKGGK